MSILLMPLCLLRGHRPDRQLAWHDGLDMRAPCRRCGRSLVRGFPDEWRVFGARDFSPQRDGYDMAMLREQQEDAAEADDAPVDPAERLTEWRRTTVSALTGKAVSDSDANAMFDILEDELSGNPYFNAALEGRRLTDAARTAIVDAAERIVQPSLPPPAGMLDQVARYVFARALAGRPALGAGWGQVRISTGGLGAA